MHELAQGVSRFGSLALSVLPWLAIGVVAAAVVKTFVPQRWAGRLLGGRAGLPVAITAGALMPGCSRTTLPIAIGLRGMAGTRLGSLTALVFVAPLLSPITVALTWSVLGWRMTVARVTAALAGSALLGALINRFESWFEADRRPRIMGASPELDHCCSRDPTEQNAQAAPARAVWRRLASTVYDTSRRVLPYFLAVMALAAAVSTLLPEDAIPTALGGAGGMWVYLLAAVAGAPLYVCQGEEVPLTFAVLASGVAPGPALTFLLGAVGMCLPTVVIHAGCSRPASPTSTSRTGSHSQSSRASRSSSRSADHHDVQGNLARSPSSWHNHSSPPSARPRRHGAARSGDCERRRFRAQRDRCPRRRDTRPELDAGLTTATSAPQSGAPGPV